MIFESERERGKIMKLTTGFALLLLALTAAAQSHLDVQTTVQKEVVIENAAGEEEKRLVQADRVVPGEKVIYTITFTNVSDESADSVVITNPIAKDLVYVDESATGEEMDIQFSADDGKTFAAAADLTVAENGGTRPAKAEDFTHVRWVMRTDLAAGAQGTARFAAILE